MKTKEKPKREYAILMYIGPKEMEKPEYWITFSGHAHSQALTGQPVGTFAQVYV